MDNLLWQIKIVVDDHCKAVIKLDVAARIKSEASVALPQLRSLSNVQQRAFGRLQEN